MSKKLRDNFNVRVKLPLDKRFVVESLNEIDTPYESLKTYNKTEKREYQYKNGSFLPLLYNDECINIETFGAIGDGITDNTTIIQSLLTTYSGKKIVLIPSGTFMTGKLFIPENTHLIILGTLKLKNNENNQLMEIYKSNVVIDGMGKGVIDGNRTNQNTSSLLACIYNGGIVDNIIIKGLTITNAKEWGINIIASNSSIIDCVICNHPNMSFFATGSYNVSWINCECYDITFDHGIGFYGGVNNGTIRGCIVHDIKNTQLVGIGVINDEFRGEPNKNIIIDNCIAYNNSGNGIGVWGVQNYDENITITNCIAYNNNLINGSPLAVGGIIVKKAKNVVVKGCITHDNGGGLGGATGVVLGDCEKVTIDSNIIYNEGTGSTNGYGIIGDCKDTHISNNKIYDNQTTKTMTKCIQIQAGSSNVEIINNDLSGSIDTNLIFGEDYCTHIKDNLGFNPRAFNSLQPTLPSSNIDVINTKPYDMIVYIWGGTVTQISIGGIPLGVLSGMFILPPNVKINIIYTSTPSWKWYAK